MEEIWRDIEGYDGLYVINKSGEIKRVYKNKKEKILRTHKNNRGYVIVTLSKDSKIKKYKVHRLVAKAFIDNPNNLPQVNHKDENKENNCVENLEWCDNKYNNNYGRKNKRIKNLLSSNFEERRSEDMEKPIIVYQKNVDSTSNKMIIPKKIVEQWGKSFYMEIYQGYIKLVPIKKAK